MNCNHNPMTSWSGRMLGVLLLAAVFCTAVQAQDGAADRPPGTDGEIVTPEGIQIDRPGDTLPAAVNDTLAAANRFDTALLFTNTSNRQALVLCKSFDSNGAAVGNHWLSVPGKGLSFALASDISNGVAFIGATYCAANEAVIGSAVFAGGGAITDMPASQADHLGDSRIGFPVVSTF